MRDSYVINDINMKREIEYKDCKFRKRLYNIGQYWCSENHDMMHCDENCPFRKMQCTEKQDDKN